MNRLLRELAPDEQKHYAAGAAAVEDEIKKRKKGDSHAKR